MTTLPHAAPICIGKQTFDIRAFDASNNDEQLNQAAIQIIASGPSIKEIDFTSSFTDTATLFVNGSMTLAAQHSFTHIAGWVISDARFVAHQPDMFITHYHGEPLYATLAVFEALARVHPNIIRKYHSAMRVIFPVDRPWGVKSNQPWYQRLPILSKKLRQKTPLSTFTDHPSFVIDVNHQPAAIGVSLNVTEGFVEAGTVAYVAAQLAFTKGAKHIHLYGIDLLNANQPRFYENKDNSAPCKLDKAVADRIVPSFDLLAIEYQKRDVRVYNHSTVSKKLFNKLDEFN